MIEAREEESSRIGRVLHDEIGQLLTAAGLHLDAARQCSPGEEQRRQLDEAQEVFERLIDVVRELSHSLPPATVERVGLSFALEQLVAGYRHDGAPRIRLMHDPRARVDARSAQAMFRIAESALDNAVQHSGAPLIEILLRPTAKGVLLEIKDGGRGFDAAKELREPSGIGLLLMRHSAERGGLKYSVASTEGGSTIVSVLASPASEGQKSASADKASYS